MSEPLMWGIYYDATTAGLLKACVAAYRDDTPRLVLADHWDEQGEPYGAFLRASIVARDGPPYATGEPETPQRDAAHRRAWELRNAYGGCWAGGGWHDSNDTYRFERGLLVVSTTSAGNLPNQWATRSPLVAGLRYRATTHERPPERIKDVVMQPVGLLEVGVHPTWRPERYAEALLNVPAAPHCVSLVRFTGPITQGWVDRFQAVTMLVPHAPALAHCRVEAGVITDRHRTYDTPEMVHVGGRK
ncbi:TIGR02996 domain-containing protein [Fimbriiglobus ruber]|uniref:Uncharacterized protein n=1 Tax=Fimbriiglobus ruber TaxID=1908690 RepID=A0A225DBP1_9BACT|nr:TIGR02996 domain-containing protein [Fimbriiglobus ruber]OWK38403.1 hypothetical protein FRUB_07523 [Fimbriiglobus ruber]